jgi:hypothetical protein
VSKRNIPFAKALIGDWAPNLTQAAAQFLPEKSLGQHCMVQPLAKWGPKPPLSTAHLPPLSFLQPDNLRRLSVIPISNTLHIALVLHIGCLLVSLDFFSRGPPLPFIILSWAVATSRVCISGRFIRILCPSTGDLLTALNSAVPVPSRRRHFDVNHTSHIIRHGAEAY